MRFTRVATTKTKLNVMSIDPEIVLVGSEDGKYCDKIETIEHDKFENN